MKSVINVYTPNSEPSKESECDKAKKNICAISSMVSAFLTDLKFMKEKNNLILHYLPPGAALQRFWEDFLSLVF